MATKLNVGLDPAAYVAFTASLCTGSTDAAELRDHADQLLSAIQGGDLTIINRNMAAMVLSGQMVAQTLLQRAVQTDDTNEMVKLVQLAKALGDASERFAKSPLIAVQAGKSPVRYMTEQQIDAQHRQDLISKGLLLTNDD